MTRYGYEHEYDDEEYCHENCVFCVFDIACDGDCGRQDDDRANDEDEEHCEDEGEDGDDTEDDDENDCEYQEPLLVTPSEAADLLAISVATLWELVRRDRIRCEIGRAHV